MDVVGAQQSSKQVSHLMGQAQDAPPNNPGTVPPFNPKDSPLSSSDQQQRGQSQGFGPAGNSSMDQNPVSLSQMLATAINNGSTGSNKTASGTSASTAPVPEWRLELIMEKLRQKRAALKPLPEIAKNLRQALMERRCFLDASDKLHLQKCLDTLQQSIKVNSLSSMVERLDMVSRQLGLKLSPGANEQEWFISSDMFYLEVLIDSGGVVRDMKIQHEGKTEQLQCPDLIKSLEAQDFKDFAAHLQGLISIYNLNADKNIKSKAFIALHALEADLAAMASTYSFETKADQTIMKHLLGHFQPRRGGHPVKMTYYISPYEFIDKESKTCIPNEISEIVKRQIGTSATVSIQGSPGINRKLQMSTNVTVYRNPEGKAMPRYGNLNSTNSTALPACFVLKLDKPIPIFKGLLSSIQSITGIENNITGEPEPILNLITQVVSDNQLDCSEEKGLFVSLPDQHHCYFMTETSGLEGVLISSVSFTLASQLPLVLGTLRQQLMFNTLVGSCVRPSSKPDNSSIVFEVSALSHHNLSVSFQHPLDDSLVTLEFDIRDVMMPFCRVHALYSTTPDMIPTLEEHACSVVRRSMSIPVTVRAVIRRWQSMRIKTEVPKPDSLIPAPSANSNGSVNPLLPLTAPSCGLESQQTQQTSFKPMNYNAPAQTAPIDFISYMNNPIFASLSQNFQSQSQNGKGTQGQLAAAAAVGHGSIPSSSVLQGLLDQNNPAKRRKRNRTSTEIQKSPILQKSPIRQEEPGSAAHGWMSELGLEQDCRWNIDITPVNNSQAAEELKRKFPVKRSVSLDSNVESDDRLPSLSITPVNASAGTSTTVNSLLASIRPGIEIIPLSNAQNPPNIPNSITVTPILPNSSDMKKIKKRVEETLEKKKIKKLEVKHINKSQQQGGKPSVSAMKSVSSPNSKAKKILKPSIDFTKKAESKMDKDKSLVIYQPPKTQAATQAVANALAASKTQGTHPVKKAGILDSVINKLKSAQGADCDSVVKKEQMSTKDLLKASSSITDMVQKNASKVNEYSVRTSSGLVPGGGLKLTINKSITAPKFGLDMKKKTVMKKPLGPKPNKPSLNSSKDEQKRPLVKKEEMSKITDTRKLFMPTLESGSLFKDSPKFDLKNFQIPKKSKPLEKIDTSSAPPQLSVSTTSSSSSNMSTSSTSLQEKSVPPELVVEAINPPPVAAPQQPQATPPRQSTPQPFAAAPVPPAITPPPVSRPPSVTPPPLLPINLASSLNQPLIEPIAPPPPSRVEEPIVKQQDQQKQMTSDPGQSSQPQAAPVKETIISPESPEPMDTSEASIVPQNIPTTPPTTAEEVQKPPAEPEAMVTSIPPRATTPVPPPRSVTPAPPSRSSTPAPVAPPPTTANGSGSNNVVAPPPVSRPPSVPPTSTPSNSLTDKVITLPGEEPPVSSSLPSPSAEHSGAVVSMHCIVKSPAPNSPMLLRSPALIVQSPHTPFTIDDDLMDEALIGGGPSSSDKTAS